jgi:hypothetical protein
MMETGSTASPIGPVADPEQRSPIRFGTGFRARRIFVLLGWTLLPLLIVTGAIARSPLHFISAVILSAALWPVTVRSGELLWDGSRLLVRRCFRFAPLDPREVEAAVVTPPMFRRQSLVLRLHRPLWLSRYVYCRLSPESVCQAWALIHERGWEPR